MIRDEKGLDVREIVMLCNGSGENKRIEGSTFLIDYANKKYWEMRAGSRVFIEDNHHFGYRHYDKILCYPEYQLENKDSDIILSIKSELLSLGYNFH